MHWTIGLASEQTYQNLQVSPLKSTSQGDEIARQVLRRVSCILRRATTWARWVSLSKTTTCQVDEVTNAIEREGEELRVLQSQLTALLEESKAKAKEEEVWRIFLQT